MVVGYISLIYGLVIVDRTVVKGDCFGNKSIIVYSWSAPGIEPGTSCTRSRNHTSRPSGHFLMKISKHYSIFLYTIYFISEHYYYFFVLVLFIIKINQYIWYLTDILILLMWNYILCWTGVVVIWAISLNFSWKLVNFVPGKYSAMQFLIKDILNDYYHIWVLLYPEKKWILS